MGTIIMTFDLRSHSKVSTAPTPESLTTHSKGDSPMTIIATGSAARMIRQIIQATGVEEEERGKGTRLRW